MNKTYKKVVQHVKKIRAKHLKWQLN